MANEIVSISPNPTADILNLKLPENWQNKNYNLQILDERGGLVLQLENKIGNSKIDVTNYSTGIYFGKISLSDKVIGFKFLKK